MEYYHATTKENFEKIVEDGVIKTGFDGIIYLTDSKENALKFVALRPIESSIIVIEIDVPDESRVFETFDHSFNFFKCKSYGYPDDIHTEYIVRAWEYPPVEENAIKHIEITPVYEWWTDMEYMFIFLPIGFLIGLVLGKIFNKWNRRS